MKYGSENSAFCYVQGYRDDIPEDLFGGMVETVLLGNMTGEEERDAIFL